jgi:hypothetical protein
MPSSWVHTEYSIHQVQHHPKIDSLPLPTQLSSFPQLQINKWIESQLPLCLPPNRPPPSAPPISHDHGLQVHLQTRSVTASECISEFPPSRPPSGSPNSLDYGLLAHLRTRSITASKCISILAWSRPPSGSPNSLDHGLPVHLHPQSITASKCISQFTRSRPPSASPNWFDHPLEVNRSGATVGVRRYRGNGGGMSDAEYIFGIPRGR